MPPRRTKHSERYTISGLSSRAGVPISTIKFYLREGLLPRPAKTGKTRAHYSHRHLERLRFIEKIQTESRMPIRKLREITEMLDASERREREEHRRDPSARRTALVASAIPLFRERGYEALTIAEIIGGMGIGRSTFYRNFKNKKDLFLACVEKVLLDEASELQVEGEGAGSDLIGIFERQMEALKQADPLWRDMISMLRAAAISDPAGFEEQLEKALRMKIELYEKRIRAGIRQGFLRKVNPTVLAVMSVGIQDACSEYFSKWGATETGDRVFEEVIDIVLHGIRNLPPPP